MTKVFILGNPRSGTSLLRLMLNSHTHIAAPPECGFLQWWLEKYKTWNAASGKSRDDVEAFVSDLLTSRKVETWALDRASLVRFILERQPSSYGELGALVYACWAWRRGQSPRAIVDKNNYYIRHLEELHAIWPEALYIHLVRDGRDVACSYKDISRLESSSPYKPVLPVAMDEIAKEWRDNNENIMSFLGSLPGKRSIRVKYEDLVQNSREVLAGITAFLDLPFDERMLRYYEFNDEPVSTLDWKKKTLERPDPTTVGRYRKLLGQEEVARFEQIAGEMLINCGYGSPNV